MGMMGEGNWWHGGKLTEKCMKHNVFDWKARRNGRNLQFLDIFIFSHDFWPTLQFFMRQSAFINMFWICSLYRLEHHIICLTVGSKTIWFKIRLNIYYWKFLGWEWRLSSQMLANVYAVKDFPSLRTFFLYRQRFDPSLLKTEITLTKSIIRYWNFN